jgi:PAS domain-containing protein
MIAAAISAVWIWLLVVDGGLTKWALLLPILPAFFAGKCVVAVYAGRRPFPDAKTPLDAAKNERIVYFRELDGPCRTLAERTRRARGAVVSSRVYAEDRLDKMAGEAELRRHEWEIALELQQITTLRAHHEAARRRHAELDGGDRYAQAAFGPITSEVQDPQQRILAHALGSVEARVVAMEDYAAKVKAADAALLDWDTAQDLASLNDKFLDLAARTAADESAVGQMKDLTGQAATAAEAFRISLRQAGLAAEVLVFTDDARPAGQLG